MEQLPQQRWGEHPSLTAFPLFLERWVQRLSGRAGNSAEVSRSRAVGSQQEWWHCSSSGCVHSEISGLSPEGDHTQNNSSSADPHPAGYELGAELPGTKTLGGMPSSRAGGTEGVTPSGHEEHWGGGRWAGAGRGLCWDARAPVLAWI